VQVENAEMISTGFKRLGPLLRIVNGGMKLPQNRVNAHD
jgi:hypothetical protein